jgi:hypothetical protein
VSFDGCCTPANPYCPVGGNNLIEAKAEQYEKHMVNDTTWKDWFRGAAGMEQQMDRQNRTAGAAGWKVLWFFAEPRPAAFFAKFAHDEEFSNISVFYVPAVQP